MTRFADFLYWVDSKVNYEIMMNSKPKPVKYSISEAIFLLTAGLVAVPINYILELLSKPRWQCSGEQTSVTKPKKKEETPP